MTNQHTPPSPTTHSSNNNHDHVVHFTSPHPTLRRFPSQTKSWTDQPAPEPFSTPNKCKRGGRLGECNGVGNRMYPSSYHGKKSCSVVFRRSSSHDTDVKTNGAVRRGASFSQRDFPCLSPSKPQPKVERMSSWSAVAGSCRSVTSNYETGEAHGNSDIDEASTQQSALDKIPPPPLMEPIKQVSFRQDPQKHEINLCQSYPPHESLLSQPPRSHLRSVSLSFSSSNNINNMEHSPFDKFTTMSRSCLQNDIGTLLSRYNRIDEAMERYLQSIEVAKQDRDGLMVALDHLTTTSNGEEVSISVGEKRKCPKVTEAEGLAWFHSKLLKGDVGAAPPSVFTHDVSYNLSASNNTHNVSNILSGSNDCHSPQTPTPYQPAGFGGLAFSPPRRLRSASFAFDHVSFPTKSFDHHHHQQQHPARKFSMPSCPQTAPYTKPTIHEFTRRNSHSTLQQQQYDKKVAPIITDNLEYSCPQTPLGLEYISDPLPVLGTALRNLVSSCLAHNNSVDELNDFGILDINQASVSERRKRMVAALFMDSAALIGSMVNLGGCKYKSGTLEEVRDILEEVLEEFDFVKSVVDKHVLEGDMECKRYFMQVFGLLEVIAHLNMGTVLYRMNKVRDAKSSFERAQDVLEKKRKFGDDNNQNNFEMDTNSSSCEHHPHDDNRLPSDEYLLLVTRASIARVLLRLNEVNDAEEMCKLIADDNKPHKRNSTRLLRATSHNFGGGYTRSDSFSVTTSAVNTAAAAYQHNLDRRYKWLSSVAELFLTGMVHEARGESNDYKSALTYYNRLLSETRKKFDHRHPFICSLLERRGAVLFEQRKLQCSMLSYLACLKILEHQQYTNNMSFHEADLARILYAVARVLHDKEDYHDALHMYQRALVCQRSLAGDKPSLNVITTLCNISRVHHLCGEIDEALTTNKEVLTLATMLVGGKMDHPFLIHRLKVEGNILIEAGRLDDAMSTFINAARRCCEDGRNRMISTLMGGGSSSGNAQEDADAGDSSVLSMRSAAALAHIAFLHPAAPAG